MERIATWPASDRAELIREASALKGMPVEFMEKDFWVCWVLHRLFRSSDMARKILFKGGTSLSRYALAKPGTMRLLPPPHVRTSIEADYAAMEFMFFGERPAFGDMMDQIAALKNEINLI